MANQCINCYQPAVRKLRVCDECFVRLVRRKPGVVVGLFTIGSRHVS